MTRIIAGAARGRRLAVPPGQSTRPTSDRAREGLFGTLESLHGPLAGARFLDLYAGTGAVGLEAMSRGAATATLVESAPGALAVLRANVAAVQLLGAEVIAGDVQPFLANGAGPRAAYAIVFADPPYATSEDVVADMLAALAEGGWLTAGAILAVERATKGPPPRWPTGCVGARERRYGDGTIFYAVAKEPQ